MQFFLIDGMPISGYDLQMVLCIFILVLYSLLVSIGLVLSFFAVVAFTLR